MQASLIKNRSLIMISGDDRFTFLQGLISADINDISTPGSAIYTLIMSPQGKYLFDPFITSHENYFLCDIHSKFLENFIKKMQFYKLRSKVEINIFPEELLVFSAPEKITDEFFSFSDPRSEALGRRIYTRPPEFTTNDNEEIYQQLRLKNLIPEACYDLIPEKSFPLEYGLEKFGTISFTKGCYVGQEVITRTHHRGTIRKKLYLVQGNSFPSSGEILERNEEQIGLMCSSSGDLGFMLLRNEFAPEKNSTFHASGGNYRFIKALT